MLKKFHEYPVIRKIEIILIKINIILYEKKNNVIEKTLIKQTFRKFKLIWCGRFREILKFDLRKKFF